MSSENQIRPISVASLSGQGRRENNEDYLYPEKDSGIHVNGLYMVCDGVGGLRKGEVASATLCKTMSSYISHCIDRGESIGKSSIEQAVEVIKDSFSELAVKDDVYTDMASTLTMVYLRERDIILAHCGDSRIYHIRNGIILYRTEDHSLVNWLVKRGDILEEESDSHSQRNVILRSISLKTNSSDVDIQALTQIKTGDFIFLCSDGIMEAWKDESELADLFEAGKSTELIVQDVESKCKSGSSDNYTCICIAVETPLKSSARLFLTRLIKSVAELIKYSTAKK